MHNLLAIDPATVTGWATKDEYGTWNLKKRKQESDGIKWLRFRAMLDEMCKLAKITIIAYERPSGRHAGAVIHHAKLAGIIEEYCADNELEHVAYSATEIKKHATGKGNCNKDAMIESAKSELDYSGNDNNEADALWLWNMAADDLGL